MKKQDISFTREFSVDQMRNDKSLRAQIRLLPLCIYCFWNDSGSLLYVGWTVRPLSRWNAHLQGYGGSDLDADEVASVSYLEPEEIVRIARKYQVVDVEYFLITSLNSKYNQFKGARTKYMNEAETKLNLLFRCTGISEADCQAIWQSSIDTRRASKLFRLSNDLRHTLPSDRPAIRAQSNTNPEAA